MFPNNMGCAYRYKRVCMRLKMLILLLVHVIQHRLVGSNNCTMWVHVGYFACMLHFLDMATNETIYIFR